MIRVLHIFNIMNHGGAETMILNIYRNINRENIQFDFLCMGSGKGAYDDEIYSLGGKIYRVNPPSKVGYLHHIKEIIKICKKNKYKAVHCPTQFHSGIICLAAYLAKVPIRIVHSHSAGDKSNNCIRRLYNFVCRRLINLFATDKIACGELAGKFLFGKKMKNVLILHNGIDLEKYCADYTNESLKIRSEYGIKQEEIVIGHVGRFVKLKNHDFFVNLAEYFKRHNINVKIMLVGDGELKNEIERKVKEQELDDFVIFTGVRDDICTIMNCFDVFVMPSFYEGFPMTIIEALATGINCVVSENISKEVDIIEDSIEFIPLEKDYSIWTKAILEKSKKKENRIIRKKQLGKNGFSVQHSVNVLSSIYERT